MYRLGLCGTLGEVLSFAPETFAFSEKLLGRLGMGLEEKKALKEADGKMSAEK